MLCSQCGISGVATSISLIQTEYDDRNWHIMEVELTVTLDVSPQRRAN